MKRDSLHIFLAFACFVFYGCDIANIRSQPYVATVNGEKIYLSELQDRMATELGVPRDSDVLKSKKLRDLKGEILEKLIGEKIMQQRAEALSLKVTDDELAKKIEEIKRGYSEDRFTKLFAADKIHYEFWKEAQRRRLLLEKVVAIDVNSRITVSEEELRTYKESRPKEGAAESRIRVLQILLYNQDHAEKVLKRLKRGEDFGKVAKEESISPEATKGGDLGYFRQGVMPEAIDKAVFALPVGRISGIVKSPYGFHIFKVIARDSERDINRPDIQDALREELRKQKEAALYLSWMKDLRGKAAVKIKNDMLNPKS